LRKAISILLICLSISLFAQDKELPAKFNTDKIRIDGLLNEIEWQTAYKATDFVTYSPTVNKKPRFKTEVKVLYDNKDLYIGAIMFDTNPDSICAELTVRDNDNGNTDMFVVTLNPNKDGQNAYEFKITAANVQTDVRLSTGDNDYAWNAVWESAVSITDSSWTVEIKIPYSAIRFPSLPLQEWSVNFWRIDRRIREVSTWQLVDKAKGSKTEQMGLITGLENLEPPLRLSFNPYVATYVNHYSENDKPSYSFNGGLDMKLGLSASYTLDMTLIPDFGQEKSDYETLNLTPYETYYEENRQFFTEGTELFNKCGLFYSRRIGRIPSGYYEIDSLNNSGYVITNKPRYSKLINAFKITGRDKNNLGVGIFNAITANTYARAVNPDGEEESFLIEPYANYNMLVLDKTFKKHSYVNFTNANVLRPGSLYFSNVIGSSLRLMDKTNNFGVEFNGSWSYINDSLPQNLTDGYSLSSRIGKFNGKWNYHYSIDLLSDNYNPNDMGYLRQNNTINQNIQVDYRHFEPVWELNEFYQTFRLWYNTLYEDASFTKSFLESSTYLLTKNHLSFWNDISIELTDQFDYFEPRVPGRFLRRPMMFVERVYFSSDYRKVFAVDFIFNKYWDTETRDGYYIRIGPRIRVSNRLTVKINSELDFDHGDRGYVASFDTDSVIMGIRNVNTFTNRLNFNFVLTNKMYISFDARHYWSKVDYLSYHELLDNGTLSEAIPEFENSNINFNAFNIDILFSWNFAPGSFLSIVYKNQVYTSEDFVVISSFPKPGENFANMFKAPQVNSLSLKILYYIDWQYLQKTK
jgi:hypothetical protein